MNTREMVDIALKLANLTEDTVRSEERRVGKEC